jgi:hypothetical protein
VEPVLKPIPVPSDLKPIGGDDLGGVIGVVVVLMEEDNVTDDGAQAGHAALNSAVQNALDDIIATLGFGHTDITDDDINAYLSKMQQAISNAVEAEQNFFENIWSFLNADDLIGSRVFYFKHDHLAGGEVTDFSQRWRNEGDWELYGSVNASVACTAAAAADANQILAELFGSAAEQMSAFRDQEFRHENMRAWWSLIDRNAPQLASAIRNDPNLAESAGSLFKLAAQLRDRQRPIADEQFDQPNEFCDGCTRPAAEKARLDASQMLSLLEHLRGENDQRGHRARGISQHEPEPPPGKGRQPPHPRVNAHTRLPERRETNKHILSA